MNQTEIAGNVLQAGWDREQAEPLWYDTLMVNDAGIRVIRTLAVDAN